MSPLISSHIWLMATVENDAPFLDGKVQLPLSHPRAKTLVKSSTGWMRPTVVAATIGAYSAHGIVEAGPKDRPVAL
jgi:hypothetical protein